MFYAKYLYNMPHLIKEKILFLHVPKTGGTNILNYFVKRHDSKDNLKLYYPVGDLEWSHATYDMCKKELGNIFNEIYKFTIVRNPYDKMVSEFFYRKKYNYKRTFNSLEMNFEKFINHLYENFQSIKQMPHIEQSHFIPQKKFCGEGVNEFKFEKFEEIILFLNKKFNLAIVNKKENQSEHSNYKEYYNDEIAKKIFKLYEEDFDYFKYPSNYLA